MAEEKKGGRLAGIIKGVVGEAAVDSVLFTVIHWFFEKLMDAAKHPEIQKVAVNRLVDIVKGNRGRDDELACYASLIGINVSEEAKLLFLKKHREMLDPIFTGRTGEEIKDLRRKQDRAKGLVFLIAADKSVNAEKTANKFVLANKIWYGIFLGIEKCPNDVAKLALLEERIIHFGKNSQEGMTFEELRERTGELFSKPLAGLSNASAGVISNQSANLTDLKNSLDRAKDELAQAKINRQNRKRGVKP